jgi:hypothetical protein
MRGLDPRIHLHCKVMDCRVKPGNDRKKAMQNPWLLQALYFLGFTGFSFVLLRLSFQYVAQGKALIAAAPALALFGVLSAVVFLRMKLADLLLWHLLFLLMIFVGWRQKTRVEAARLDRLADEAAAQTGADASEIRSRFLAARQVLTIGFGLYVIAFLATFFYLYPRP